MILKTLVKTSLLSALILFSCHREKISPADPSSNPELSNQKLFLAGRVGPGAIFKPAIWKEGRITMLSDSYGQAFALDYSDSTKIYTIGYLNSSIAQTSLWTNNASPTLFDGYANDIAVSEGDVYAAGYSNNDAVYWKNGEKTVVTHGLGVTAQVYRVLVENNNIHLGINVLNNDLFSYTTIYWKNGVSKTISSSTRFGDMVVFNSDVYILSTDTDDTSVIWKNGTVIASFGGKGSTGGKNYEYITTGMTVSNGIIYVSGVKNNYQTVSACYWKISLSDKSVSTPIILPYDFSQQQINFVSIGAVGNDIYVSGHDDGANKTLLWKNGALIAPFDGSTSGDDFFINRICVVKN